MKDRQSLIVFFCLVFSMAVLASTANWWLPSILSFILTNTSLIQGLADFIQIALWIGILLVTIGRIYVKNFSNEERSRSKKARPKRKRIDVLGDDPDALTIFEYLQSVITANAAYIPNYSLRETSSKKIVQDLREGVLRVYFFGHQSAGKSSLINALLEKEISPTFPSKMTTCLVRIRWGEEPLLIEQYEEGGHNIGHRISKLKRQMEEWANIGLDSRPREVVVEIPHQFLYEYNIELVDSPGTGGSWDRVYGLSLEDEIVSSKIQSAAVVVIVYRYASGDLQAHERLINEVGNRNIATIGVCNLDPNWAEKIESNKKETQLVISRAETKLRNIAKARCFRIPIDGSESVRAVASRAYGETVKTLQDYLVKLLDDRKSLIIRQATLDGRALLDDLLWDIERQAQRYKPLFDKVEAELGNILDAINSVRATLNRGYTPVEKSGTIWGSAIVGTAAPAAIAAILTGGTAIPLICAVAASGAAVGAVGGAAAGEIQDAMGRKEYKKQLAYKWTSLQRSVTSSSQLNNGKVISNTVLKKVKSSSSSLTEAQHRSILGDIEKDLDINLKEVEGYFTYKQSRKLQQELKELKGYFR